MKKLDGFRDIMKNTKRRKPTQIFCPRCCSPKIQLNSSLDVWLTPKSYYCPECGYHGILVMELEPEADASKEFHPEESSQNEDLAREKEEASPKA
jgi:late competence protein required for DNA uptake (superfamily II DNA/RNA helicase)